MVAGALATRSMLLNITSPTTGVSRGKSTNGNQPENRSPHGRR